MSHIDILKRFKLGYNEFNFGVLKKVETGEVVGFAPYFDHNLGFNAHLNTGENIGLGLYKLCKSTVGIESIRDFLKAISIKDIYEIDEKVRKVLGTQADFSFVIDYFKVIFEDMKIAMT